MASTVPMAAAAILSLTWAAGWGIHRAAWRRDRHRSRREVFMELSPLHRITRGTVVYRLLADGYLGLCLAGCAFAPNAPWAEAAAAHSIPQVLRGLWGAGEGPPPLILVYVLLLTFLPFSAWLNRRLKFLVEMNFAAWHNTLDSPGTQELAEHAVTWTKPRFRPPGHVNHYALLLVHLMYPTFTPLVVHTLASSFLCDAAMDDARFVARFDPSVPCFEGRHIAHAVTSFVLLLLYYAAFLVSSYYYVAATERLEHRNQELWVPSLVRDRRRAFFFVPQAVMLAVGCDVFLSHSASPLSAALNIAVAMITILSLIVFCKTTHPCNVPVCNWVALASLGIPALALLLALFALLLPPDGMPLLVTALLVIWPIYASVATCVVLAMWRSSKGSKGKPCAWVAERMAEARLREQMELAILNSAPPLAASALSFDVERLPTPRSYLEFSPRSLSRALASAGPTDDHLGGEHSPAATIPARSVSPGVIITVDDDPSSPSMFLTVDRNGVHAPNSQWLARVSGSDSAGMRPSPSVVFRRPAGSSSTASSPGDTVTARLIASPRPPDRSSGRSSPAP